MTVRFAHHPDGFTERHTGPDDLDEARNQVVVLPLPRLPGEPGEGGANGAGIPLCPELRDVLAPSLDLRRRRPGPAGLPWADFGL